MTASQSSMNRQRAVLIVGAGPTGLTLGVELARRGVPFRIIEAAPGPQPGSRGKGLQPRSLEVFEDLGIIDRVLANGRLAMPIRSTTTVDGSVAVSGAEPLVARPDVPYGATLITPQWRTEEALRLRLEELGGVVEFGTALESFEQSADLVSVVLAAGGRAETMSVAWLIGCDGGHSAVRHQTGIPFEGETRDEVRMIVADVAVDGLDREAWHMWRHAEGMASLCPLPSTELFQYQASIAPGQDPTVELANMQAILDRRAGRTDLRLRQPEWSSLWRANIRLVDRYRQGRVFLAGDAAHIHSPAGGQGMNTGIQDAYNLAWKLAAVIQHHAPDTLLDTYEAERRPVAEGVLALSNARLAQTIARNEMPTRRDATTMQLGVNYRGSTLATDDRDPDAALRAGDRAPDATDLLTTTGTHRLFDLIGGGFTLLAFGPIDGAVPAGVRTLRVVDRPTRAGEIADSQSYLAEAYGPADQTLVLLRPDGYVGVISDAGDLAAVKNYLADLRISR